VISVRKHKNLGDSEMATESTVFIYKSDGYVLCLAREWGVFLQKAEIPFTSCNSCRSPKPQERRGLELGNCGNPFLQKIFLTRPAGGSG
jgi:hypothetical protein